MFSKSFIKPLSLIDYHIEQDFIDEIKDAKKSAWMTAVQHKDGSIDFVKDKPNAGFFTARLKKFPNIVKMISNVYPDVVIEHSYVTKLLPGYRMLPHIDKNRDTAILIPLGDNKGEIEFRVLGFKIHTHQYNGPTLARVDIVHSANNTSDEIRYALTLEVPGTFKENLDKYK